MPNALSFIVPGSLVDAALFWDPVAAGLDPDLVEGLEFFNIFGGASPVGRNLIRGKPQAVVAGAPVVDDAFVTLVNGADYIQTAVEDRTDVTFLAVVRLVADDGLNAWIVTNNLSPSAGGGTTTGKSLYWATGTAGDDAVAIRMFAAIAAGGSQEASLGSQPSPQTQAYCVAGRVSPTKVRKVNNLTTGGSATNSSSSADLAVGGPFRLGSRYSGSGGTVEMYAAAIWSRELTDPELAEIYNFLKTLLAGRGVTL